MEKKSKYLHVGCHHTAPEEWTNIEASPYLYMQKIPLVGRFFVNKNVGAYPPNVKYGNIVTGISFLTENSCKGIYCSHVLEHLPLNDFRIALKNLFSYLQPGGLMRIIVPDLEWAARNYIMRLDNRDKQASLDFCDSYTYFGTQKSEKTFNSLLRNILGTSKHHWMWDSKSLSEELKNVGFTNIRLCSFNDSTDTMFGLVEEQSRFLEESTTKSGLTPAYAVAIECSK